MISKTGRPVSDQTRAAQVNTSILNREDTASTPAPSTSSLNPTWRLAFLETRRLVALIREREAAQIRADADALRAAVPDGQPGGGRP